jgi:ATP-dependent Clp protease ATP-binding subunit ClpA
VNQALVKPPSQKELLTELSVEMFLKICMDKTLYSLDMGALIAGAKYKGEFEERLKSVVNEVIKSDGQIILLSMKFTL